MSDTATTSHNAEIIDLNQTAQSTEAAPTAPRVEVVERLSEADKASLDIAKMKREVALANAKTALAQSENAETSYNNTILQLALRYKLVEGDIIDENGEIKRKGKK